MTSEQQAQNYRSIFSPSTPQERKQNFESYWQFTLRHNGEILESQKNLTLKKETLLKFQSQQVRSRRPLSDPERFYRNYLRMTEDPKTLDAKTLLLTCIYKFARHEWNGISAAWDSTRPLNRAKNLTDKISRYHLCEEFCHVRLFHEMFLTFHLDEVQWVPVGRISRMAYRVLPRLPEKIMSGPAFLTELMGMTFYLHVDRLLDSVLADEPEAKDRIRALLHEIMVDELAHIGQRRNYLGRMALPLAKKMFPWLMRMFWNDIPEGKLLFDIPQMTREGLAFDYQQVPTQLLTRSWIPSYCQSA